MIRLKNREQILGIKKSGELLFKAFDFIKSEIKPGISTWDIDRLIEGYIKDSGAIAAFKNYQGFPGSSCISNNSSVIHGIPRRDIILKSGDIVGIDIGINLNGYISDSANTYGVGKISAEDQKLLDVTKEALNEGILACRVGNRIKDIGKAITSYVEPHGYGIVHQFCGHGVGLDVHEEPQIFNNYPSSGPNPRIKPGMVLAIEPMINIGSGDVYIEDDNWTVSTADGKRSAHFEHTVAVLDTHTEILTKI